MKTRSLCTLSFLGFLLALFGVPWLTGQETRPSYKVTIKDGNVVVGEPTLPIDPTERIKVGHSGPNSFGLLVENRRICFNQNGSIWGSMKVDGNISNPFDGNNAGKMPTPLPPSPDGRKRIGTQSSWSHQGIEVTQIIEVVPGKPSVKKPQQANKRLMDTARMTYILHNKNQNKCKVAFKTSIDILIVNNDGALYASPTTAPGKILNGVALEGKEMPTYIWVLEQPNLNAPGFIATMTLKHNKGENPNKIVLSNLGVVSNFQQWDVPAQPAGDSACALFWAEKDMNPGEKRTLIWGYGGGISQISDGQIDIGLTGSFEPNKLFTITAHVEDASEGQVLALELPAGMERVEGKTMQAVGSSIELGSGLVQWKARVTKPGDYEIRIRSSTGRVQSKYVSIEAVNSK
jgi:hypothetical protein